MPAPRSPRGGCARRPTGRRARRWRRRTPWRSHHRGAGGSGARSRSCCSRSASSRCRSAISCGSHSCSSATSSKPRWCSSYRHHRVRGEAAPRHLPSPRSAWPPGRPRSAGRAQWGQHPRPPRGRKGMWSSSRGRGPGGERPGSRTYWARAGGTTPPTARTDRLPHLDPLPRSWFDEFAGTRDALAGQLADPRGEGLGAWAAREDGAVVGRGGCAVRQSASWKLGDAV